MRARLFITAALLGACWYPGDRGVLLEERVGKLSDENTALRKERAENQERLAKSQRRLDEQIESLDKAARRSDADIGIQVQRTVEDVAALRGQVEQYQHKISELETALKDAK